MRGGLGGLASSRRRCGVVLGVCSAGMFAKPWPQRLSFLMHRFRPSVGLPGPLDAPVSWCARTSLYATISGFAPGTGLQRRGRIWQLGAEYFVVGVAGAQPEKHAFLAFFVDVFRAGE